MILDKPLSVGHFGEKGGTCVIYSSDIHPDGSRFATGGGDHRVKIWSMGPFSAPASTVRETAATIAQVDGSAPGSLSKLPHHVQGSVEVLAVLPQHTGSVQCVRWSHNGRYLASASDDTYVLIWELRPGAASSAPFGTTEAPNVENWARVWGLRGHNMDVLDCAWSPDDSMVASCSIDNSVIVWRMPDAHGDGAQIAGNSAILSPHHILRQHKSFVKGVSWDPMGRFLASIGEDNRLLVWRVGGDWGVETTISTPFEGCEDTLVRRISWSPDGQCLVATNSKDRDVNRAVVLMRGRWEENPTSLVGHSAYTLVASFSPAIYYKAAPPVNSAPATVSNGSAKASGGDAAASTASGSAPKSGHQVVAVAGQDRVVTVWLAAANRPVAILREVFDKPPSDLSWGADGYTLLVSGHDGTVVFLRFTDEELGTLLPEADRRAHFIKTYGTDVNLPGSVALALDGAPVLVDNPRQLALERSQMAAKKAVAKKGLGAAATSAVPARNCGLGTLPRRLVQTESRTKGGKRRIQPTLLSNGGGPPSPSPQAPLTHPPMPPNHESPWNDGNLNSPRFGTVSEGFGSAGTTSTTSGGKGGLTNGSDVSRGVMGQKRPRVADGGRNAGGSHFQRLPLVGVRQRDAAVVRLRMEGSSARPLVSPPELMPRRGASGGLVRLISGWGTGDDHHTAGSGAFRPSSRLRQGVGRSGSAVAGYYGNSHEDRVGDGSKASPAAVLECSAVDQEFRGLPARRYTLVTVTRGGREAWRDYFAGTASACCGNSRIVAVGAEDGSIYVYDRSGVRCGPPLVLSPPVAYLECNDSPPSTVSTEDGAAPVMSDYLMAISGDGDVFVWNLGSMKLTTKSSLGPLFRSVSTGVSRQSASAPSSPIAGGSRSASASPRSGGNSSSLTASADREGVTGTGDGSGSLRISATGSGGSRVASSSSSPSLSSPSAGGVGAGSTGGASVSVARAGVTGEGMPLVMLACPGAFGGCLQAFALHAGLETWVRVADGRFALSDFYSSGPCTASSKTGILSALQAGVRTGSAPTPAALLQASRVGTVAPGSRIGSSGEASGGRRGAAGLRRESLRAAITRGHLEDSLATAALLGSPEEFEDILRAYTGHLAKNASSGDGRIRALCDKLLLGSGLLGVSGAVSRAAGGEKAVSRAEDRGLNSGGVLGLRLGEGPSVLGLDKLHLLKEVVLPALGANRSLQRLVSEYYDGIELYLNQMDLVSNASSGGAGSDAFPTLPPSNKPQRPTGAAGRASFARNGPSPRDRGVCSSRSINASGGDRHLHGRSSESSMRNLGPAGEGKRGSTDTNCNESLGNETSGRGDSARAEPNKASQRRESGVDDTHLSRSAMKHVALLDARGRKLTIDDREATDEAVARRAGSSVAGNTLTANGTCRGHEEEMGRVNMLAASTNRARLDQGRGSEGAILGGAGRRFDDDKGESFDDETAAGAAGKSPSPMMAVS